MDVLVVSPGLDPKHPAIRFALAQGAHLIGDVELFALQNQKPVLAITGANGKSTVTSLTAHMLQCSGLHAIAAGNIGLPILDALQSDADVFVLELSSFQLDTTHSLKSKAACILNVTEDHMDRYGTMAAYAASKQRVYQGTDLAIYNKADGLTTPKTPVPALALDLAGSDYGVVQYQGESWLLVQGEPLMPVRDMTIVGLHNQFNALASCALALAAGASREGLVKALQTFTSLPHRCQLVLDHKAVRWVNDSKATNVGATLAAIAGLRPEVSGKLILIAGGDGKGADFSELATVLNNDVDHLITLGQDGPAIAALKAGSFEVKDLMAAVKTAAQLATANDLVLLSPACASLDMFKNYEDRGQQFAAAVQKVWL
jgi:UDP-N-acetylmuramoylalanine--D-glutamate ligase